jgi:hypothetical protein
LSNDFTNGQGIRLFGGQEWMANLFWKVNLFDIKLLQSWVEHSARDRILEWGYPFDSGNHNKFMGQVSVVLHFMPQP